MAKRAKEKSLDFYYLDKEEKSDTKKKPVNKQGARTSRPNKTTTKTTSKKKAKGKGVESKKDEKFDFDHEIVIGVNVLPDPKKDKQSPNKKQAKPKPSSQTRGKETRSQTEQKTKRETPKKKAKNQPSKGKKATSEEEVQEKRYKRNQRVKKITFVLKCLLLLAVFIGVIGFFMISPIFNITQVEVKGNEKIGYEEILSLSGITIGENSFRILNSKVEKTIKENPYIKAVAMKRKLPDKIEISIAERTPAYMLALGNGFVYLDHQGYLLEIADTETNKPIVKGCTTKEETIKPGNRLEAQDLEKLDTVLAIMECANSNEIGSLVTTIDITDKNNYTLVLESKGKTVYLGDGTQINDRILTLKVILEKEEGNQGEVFLQDKEKVYFRAQT